jgi:hypothetical protein
VSLKTKLSIGFIVCLVIFLFSSVVMVNATDDSDGRLADTFDNDHGLITNEWAYNHQSDERSAKSNRWFVTSGSLFAKNGMGYSGKPDSNKVDPTSSKGNNSSVFRMISRNDGYEDTEMAVRFVPMSWSKGGAKNDWSGFHLFLRYKSKTELYVVSALRRNGTVTVKKKTTASGDDDEQSNGGTYTTLAEAPAPPNALRLDKPHDVRVRVTGTDTAVFEVTIDGAVVLNAIDNNDPIKGGRIGVRADDLEFGIEAVHAYPV